MPEYEVAVEMNCHKYYMIDAKNEEEAIERAKKAFKSERPNLDEKLQNHEGISIAEDAEFMVTNRVR
jgi:hypothetical protein